MEKGQPPLESLHAPLTPQSTSELQNKPDAHSAAAPEPKPARKEEYNFVTPGELADVALAMNSNLDE